LNHIQRLPILQQEEFIEDQIEQLNQIHQLEQWEAEQQQESNDEQLIQHEQWENVTFFFQQMK
jgi:aminoglycoside phosphotransferase (APT) family kinase protein